MQLLVAKPVVGRTVEPMDGRENDEEGDGKTYNNNNYYYKSTNDPNHHEAFQTPLPSANQRQRCNTIPRFLLLLLLLWRMFLLSDPTRLIGVCLIGIKCTLSWNG